QLPRHAGRAYVPRRFRRRPGENGALHRAGNDRFRTAVINPARRASEFRRKLRRAAKSAGQPFELITYPNTNHDFVKGGEHYKSGPIRERALGAVERLDPFRDKCSPSRSAAMRPLPDGDTEGRGA